MGEKLTWHFEDTTNLQYIDFKDKNVVTRCLIETMLQRTNSMFEWKGLPETIPQHYLEMLIQTNGYAGIIKHNDKLFAVFGGVGGLRNYNYEPTTLIVSNPYLLLQSKVYEVFYGNDSKIESPLKNGITTDGECVIIANDNTYKGILPLCQYYASQLVENTITKRRLSINMRSMYIFVASDEDIKNDFKDLMKNLENGDSDCVLAEDVLTDGAKTLPYSDKGHEALTDLIENEQYIKASWLNDLGLQANYNMKRESINSNESQLNKDAVLPYVDCMLAMRKLACKRINQLFGTNWSVEFSSAWSYTRTTIEQAIDAIDETSETKLGDEDEIDTTQVVNEEPNEDTNQVAGEENE